MLQNYRIVLCFWMYLCVACFNCLNAQIIDTTCTGTNKGIYSVQNHPNSKFFWKIEGGEIVSGNGTNRIEVNWGNTPGVYPIEVVEKNVTGCFGDPVKSYVWLRGKEFKTYYPNAVCIYDTATLVASGGIKYLWNNGSTDSIIRIPILKDTTIKVIISDTTCKATIDTFTMPIKAILKPIADYEADTENVYLNQEFDLVYKGKKNDKLLWELEKATTKYRTTQRVNVIFNDTGNATIKLVVMNAMGCSDSSLRYFNVKDEHIYFPNAFTPNDDGLNDVFLPVTHGMKTYTLQIFNRIDQLIFTSNDTTIGWDGKLNGEPVQQDVYLYKCDAIGNSNRIYSNSGQIAILR